MRAVTFVLAYELKKKEFVGVLLSVEFVGTRKAIRKELCRRVFRERFKIYAFTYHTMFGKSGGVFNNDHHKQTVNALKNKTAFNYHNFSAQDLERTMNKVKPLQYGSSSAEGLLPAADTAKVTALKKTASMKNAAKKVEHITQNVLDMEVMIFMVQERVPCSSSYILNFACVTLALRAI